MQIREMVWCQVLNYINKMHLLYLIAEIIGEEVHKDLKSMRNRKFTVRFSLLEKSEDLYP